MASSTAVVWIHGMTGYLPFDQLQVEQVFFGGGGLFASQDGGYLGEEVRWLNHSHPAGVDALKNGRRFSGVDLVTTVIEEPLHAHACIDDQGSWPPIVPRRTDFVVGQAPSAAATLQDPLDRLVTLLPAPDPLNRLTHEFRDDGTAIPERFVEGFLHVIGDAEIDGSHPSSPIIAGDFNDDPVASFEQA